jgi:hypothetical protein
MPHWYTSEEPLPITFRNENLIPAAPPSAGSRQPSVFNSLWSSLIY